MSTEKLVRQFLRQHSQPLVVLVSNGRACQEKDEKKSLRCAVECLGKAHGDHREPACQNLSEPYSPLHNEQFNKVYIQQLYPLDERYDIGHLNLYDMMQAILDSDAVQKHNLTRLELVGRMYHDWVHCEWEGCWVLVRGDAATCC